MDKDCRWCKGTGQIVLLTTTKECLECKTPQEAQTREGAVVTFKGHRVVLEGWHLDRIPLLLHHSCGYSVSLEEVTKGIRDYVRMWGGSPQAAARRVLKHKCLE